MCIVIDVHSPDTDDFLLLLDLCSRYDFPDILLFITGRGNNRRSIDVKERYSAVGKEKSKGLLGLHAFSGADWGESLYGVSKKR